MNRLPLGFGRLDTGLIGGWPRPPSPRTQHHGHVPNTSVFATSEASDELLKQLRQLLEAAFEDGFTEYDWRHTLGGWHVMIMVDGVPVSHAAVVPRVLEIGGRRFRCGYVEGVATAPHRRGGGLGSLVMRRLGRLVRSRFELGALSTSHPEFYERLGWERWSGPTFVRGAQQLIRTEDEDEGIMVLRFGPSRETDLTAPISCEQRDGDDW
jgi:aminoglycoside 2'-N-acetyltransferase I